MAFPAGTKDLEVRYTAPTFRVPGRVVFEYELEGYDDEWVYAGTRRSAFFTNLAPGRYTFRVRARNEDGVWGTEAASMASRTWSIRTGLVR